MAYDENTVDRIKKILSAKKVKFVEQKMFSGVCFMVDGKMCCGTHINKDTNENLLLCRIGEKEYDAALKRKGCIPMEFTGREMRGFVYVEEIGMSNDKDLSYWLQKCLDYNPDAKSSKKKIGKRK